MNVFASLAEPLRCRPGDALEEKPKRATQSRPYVRLRPNAFPQRPNPWRLTGADCEMLTRMANGEEVEEIAEALNIHPRTIKTRIARACQKTGALNRLHLVVMWDRFNRSAS